MIERLRAAQDRLSERLDAVTDDVARGPSLLPGWSVGHLLTHVARNADSVVRRLDGVAVDEVRDQYAGGPAGRAAEIDAGAGRPAAELVADVRASNAAVLRSVAAVPDDAWDRMTRDVAGALEPARSVLASRLREVEVHHVDLGLGYTAADWPADFVADELALELRKLTGRADPAALLAWLTGRGTAPTLGDWR